ncbi:MAG: HAMP domain-containing histidine kinase [Bacteroidales bacterium]|nr:HAMP domain-containing histidine kinase [Bacteroidales bacterium]
MRKRYIRLLAIIMTATVILLILVQAAWIEKALIIEEQEFRESVNKALFEVVKLTEEREAILQISESSVPFSKDSTETPGSFLFEENFIEDKKDERDTTKKKQSIYYLQGDSLYRIEAGTQDSLGNYVEFTQKDLKERIIGNISKKTIFIQNVLNRLIAGETKIEERLAAVQFKQIISKVFKTNNIPHPYYFGVKDEKNEYKLKSQNFSLDYVKETYEILIFPNDVLASKYFLVVYFKNKNRIIPKKMPREMIVSFIITLIITITFAFIIYLILKQRKLSELKNDFINNMTHELKTPVSTISLASQMLSDASIEIDKKKQKSVTKIIKDESKRLEFQIEKVLQISLFEKGNIHFNIQDVDIHDIIKLAVLNTDIKAKNKGGEIIFNLKAEHYNFKGDKLHLTNILFNLLDNAVKYSKKDVPPKIEVITSNTEEGIQIEIKDNGIGISKESQRKIFNKFFRVPTGNVHDVKGFGLGLSYVKRIVEEHKGTISIKSEAGKGANFVIFFPQE